MYRSVPKEEGRSLAKQEGGRKSAIRGGNRYDNNNNGGFIENPLGKFAGVLAPETANCVPLSAGPKKKKSRSHN